MTTKTTIWRLRVPKPLVDRVRQLAKREDRSITKMATRLLQDAVDRAEGEWKAGERAQGQGHAQAQGK